MTAQPKLFRLLKIISLLSSKQRYTIQKLAVMMELSERSMYRYLELLEESGFVIDKDFYGNYFMHQNLEAKINPVFTADELAFMRQLASLNKHPLMDSMLQKLYVSSELPPVKELIVKARLSQLVEKLKVSIAEKKQVVIKHYHSAESGRIGDRLIEPLSVENDFFTILAFDVNARQTKFFKLERMGDVIVLDQAWKFEEEHENLDRDFFGMSGTASVWIKLELSLRAYNLMREEFPATIDYLIKEDESYFFYGPIRGYEGIGRFILGLPGEVRHINNKGLIDYLNNKMEAFLHPRAFQNFAALGKQKVDLANQMEVVGK
ncbi:WYL domain-containing protein [Marivirga sp. S37H4]|uniref:WYL domain-containing protein n=1 Tax=Marivirga aurantiaca TaxID=2802615 RepID=A0A934WVD3_9BACT|nr:WYL domain-containing protein [Marivirga aurantiaca]MBK6263632.1 WYL domain-containing protein [Marivirga aurantiaca]